MRIIRSIPGKYPKPKHLKLDASSIAISLLSLFLFLFAALNQLLGSSWILFSFMMFVSIVGFVADVWVEAVLIQRRLDKTDICN